MYGKFYFISLRVLIQWTEVVKTIHLVNLLHPPFSWCNNAGTFQVSHLTASIISEFAVSPFLDARLKRSWSMNSIAIAWLSARFFSFDFSRSDRFCLWFYFGIRIKNKKRIKYSIKSAVSFTQWNVVLSLITLLIDESSNFNFYVHLAPLCGTSPPVQLLMRFILYYPIY